MRFRKIGWAIALVTLAVLAWLLRPWPSGILGWSFTDSSEDRDVFYRLVAKYQHDQEVVNFDIAVGCNVKITTYGDGGSSFDAFRYPTVFAKKTSDGGAIWQLVPDACQGHTSENGRVPSDFLPGAIWFSNANDFSFGVAYVTEDAFENPDSTLKFLGASIHSATRADWKAFRETAAHNLIDPRSLSAIPPLPSEEEIRANLWNKERLAEWWRSSFECRAVHRLRLTNEGSRDAIRNLWPASRPRFWSPTLAELETVRKYLFGQAIINGHQASRYFDLGQYRASGFPTKAGGGMILADGSGPYPTDIFPIRADEGIPWVTVSLSTAKTIHRDVEIEDGRRLGFAYCYSVLEGRGMSGELHIPGYVKREFLTRVDGEPILGEARDPSPPSFTPRPFFERDEYLYILSQFDTN